MNAARARRVLLTRPLSDARATARLLADRGVESVVAPLIDIEDVGRPGVEFDGVQAVLVTSANGARALAQATARRDVAVFAVGDASARAAQQAGFTNVASAGGDVDALAALVRGRLDPGAGTLLHVTGSAVAGNLAGDLAARGYTVRRAELYRSRTADALPEQARQALAEISVEAVLFYSPRTAARFADLVRAAGLAPACRAIAAICLSPAVADALAGLAFAHIRVAKTPDQEALLALLDDD